MCRQIAREERNGDEQARDRAKHHSVGRLHVVGAILIEGSRITKAKVVLPLSQRPDVPKTFGTRHRAAMGLAEGTDATVVVVSEEDAAARVARGAELKTLGSPAELVQALGPARETRLPRRIAAGNPLTTSRIRLKLSAVGLAAILSFMPFFQPTMKRILMVRVEFTNLPRTMMVADVSRRVVQVEVQGSVWTMDSIDSSQVAVVADLSGAQPGLDLFRVRPKVVRLPAGISVDRVLPSTVEVHVVSANRLASPRHPIRDWFPQRATYSVFR